MLKKIGLTTLTLSALLLSGCGGGGSDKNPMDSKNYIVILKNVPSGICESQIYRDLLSENLNGVITEERSNSVHCGDYGKNNDQIECGIEYYSGAESGNVACVVGADELKYNKQARIVGNSSFPSMIDIKFIQVAE